MKMMEHPMIGKFVRVWTNGEDKSLNDELYYELELYCELIHICESHITLWFYDVRVSGEKDEYVRFGEFYETIPMRNVSTIVAAKDLQEEFQLPFRENE